MTTESTNNPPEAWTDSFSGEFVNKSTAKRINESLFPNETTKESVPKAAEALRYAHDIRKFEIDLYWKRSAYFQTVLGIILGALALTLKTTESAGTKASWLISVSILQATILCIGSTLAFAWYAATRGGKYWQRNWETHVDVLEDQITGPLYKTVYSHADQTSHTFLKLLNEYPYSTSKINSFVALIFLALFIAAHFLFFFSTPYEFTFPHFLLTHFF